jgi:hypothetical protein
MFGIEAETEPFKLRKDIPNPMTTLTAVFDLGRAVA